MHRSSPPQLHSHAATTAKADVALDRASNLASRVPTPQGRLLANERLACYRALSKWLGTVASTAALKQAYRFAPFVSTMSLSNKGIREHPRAMYSRGAGRVDTTSVFRPRGGES